MQCAQTLLLCPHHCVPGVRVSRLIVSGTQSWCASVSSPVSWSGSVSSSVSCCASVLLPHQRAAGPPGVFQCPPAHSVPIYIIHVQCPYTNDFVIQNLLRHGILAQYYWVTEIFEKNNMWPKNKANECFKSLYLGVKHNAVSVQNSGLCHC